MKYNELTTKPRKSAKRVGRGISAGQGKTAGRGTKGQGARTGSKKKPGFAGGSNPLMQKLPKLPGFKSKHPKMENVSLSEIASLAVANIDNETLAKAKLVSSPYVSVKLLANGEISKKLTVKLQGASESARAAIEAAGGSFESISRLQKPKTRTDKKSAK